MPEYWKNGSNKLHYRATGKFIWKIMLKMNYCALNPTIPSFSPSRRLYDPEANIPLFHGCVKNAGLKNTPSKL
jgi:hypothetical protein